MTTSVIESTTTLGEASRTVWDVVVIGAGPAGSVAARELARLGVRVLLVDKAKFPRTKVCGCCLNGAAVEALNAIGLPEIPASLGARPLRRWRLCSSAGQAVCQLDRGYSLSREVLDAALVEHALEAGAALLENTRATVIRHSASHVELTLSQDEHEVTTRATVVVAADGLSGRSLASSAKFQTQIRPGARYGVSTLLTDDSQFYEDGTIVMACGRGGYVGLVRLEDGRLDIAAALDRKTLSDAGGPAPLCRAILESARLPMPREFDAAIWRGTPALTRRRSTLAADRVFVVGDAAGYTEPFTGEGLTWAICGAIALAPLARKAIDEWNSDLAQQWTPLHYALVGRTQYRSRLLGWLLRSSRRANIAVQVLRLAPWLAAPVIKAINTPTRITVGHVPTGP